jgi:hypothetical protein
MMIRLFTTTLTLDLWANPHSNISVLSTLSCLRSSRQAASIVVSDLDFPRDGVDNPAEGPRPRPVPPIPTDVPAPGPQDIPAREPRDVPALDPGKIAEPAKPKNDPKPRSVP